MWTARPAVDLLRKAVRRPARDLARVAVRRWEVAPGFTRPSPPAVHLPGQLERIVKTSEFGTLEGDLGKLRGAPATHHGATTAFLVRDAFLIDGVLYKGDAALHLHPRGSRWPRLRVEREIAQAAVYCTFGGNRYFGQWLMDDCATYPLAAAAGTPVTTGQPVNVHTLGYEAALGMQPARVTAAHLGEAVIFDDVGQNQSKHQRFRDLGARLLDGGVAAAPHPGVFIVRGQTGIRRVLLNERELAERLRDRRGFRIVDPTHADVPQIVAACAGARTIVGIEGSGLMHGILVLPAGGAVLVLQPPERFSAIYKDLTDRDGQRFSFVVGHREGSDFRIDPEEVERTLDLLDAAPNVTPNVTPGAA